MPHDVANNNNYYIISNLSVFLLLLSAVFVHISHELLPRHHQLLMQV